MSAIVEWLEAMYRAAGPDADLACEALEIIAAAERSEDSFCKLIDRETTGDKELDEILIQLNRLDSLDVWAERDPTFKEFGDLDEGTLERFARAYDRLEQQSFALQELAADAGLIARNDFKTNPLTLIAMFVPPAE